MANLQPAASRVWTCTEPEFRLSWMKSCSSDYHYTTAPLCYFQKLQLLLIKLFWNNFAALCFYLYEPKMCLRFIKFYFKLKTILAVKSEAAFIRGAIKVEHGKILKKISINGRSWSCAKLFIMQSYKDNANGDTPLTGENVWYF